VTAYENLRLILLGGETLSPQLIRRWQKRFGLQQLFVNLYGPTETTINITFHIVNKLLPDTLNAIAIGKPITNAAILLLNEKNEIKEKGELLITGPMLCNGYLGQSALNEEKFISFKNKKYYRTGDLVSKNEAGQSMVNPVDRFGSNAVTSMKEKKNWLPISLAIGIGYGNLFFKA